MVTTSSAASTMNLARRKRVKMEATPDMASLPPPQSVPDMPLSARKQIPLLCSVCPDIPHFSDLSHLLTHIASKGHLHHETQTKLKAHQDLVSSIALQQYEQWYTENKIESLLVERMKAKQFKEAARNKRSRAPPLASISKKNKRQTKRLDNHTTIKDEDEFASDFPNLVEFSPSDNETEVAEDILIAGEMMSLKGQVWPGMGKMDLATEEMKRTRNQRKPKSVVDKMRRTSEEIEPTQVVMTSQFDVERVKGVYDDDSPVSDQEEASPPRKPVRKRTKKTQPLAEISKNIPRRANSGGTATNTAEMASKSKLLPGHESIPETSTSLGHLREDLFRSDENRFVMLGPDPFSISQHRDARFDIRDRMGIPSLNSTPNSGMSPHLTAREPHPACSLPRRDPSRPRYQLQPYLPNGTGFSSSSFGPHETSYPLTEGSLYTNSNRFPFSPSLHYDAIGLDHHRLQPSQHVAPKTDDFSHAGEDDPLAHTGSNMFLNFGGTSSNPLFSQDRIFLSSFGQHSSTQSFPSMSSSTTSHERELAYGTDDFRPIPLAPVKVEPQHLNEVKESESRGISDGKEAAVDPKDVWQLQVPDRNLGIHERIPSEGLDF